MPLRGQLMNEAEYLMKNYGDRGGIIPSLKKIAKKYLSLIDPSMLSSSSIVHV